MLYIVAVRLFLTDLFGYRISHVLCIPFSFPVSTHTFERVSYLEALRELQRQRVVSIDVTFLAVLG